MDSRESARGSIPAAYTLLLAQELGLEPGSLAPLLAGTGITETDLRRGETLLTAAQQVAALENALTLADDTAFGVRLGRRLTIASHGPLGFLISTSRDLRTALEGAAAYAPTRISFLQVRLTEREEGLVLTGTFDVEAPPQVHRCMAEALCVVVSDLAGFILGRPAREIEIELPHADPGAGCARLPGLVRFGCAELRVHVPASIAGAANASANHALHELARTQCDAMLAALPHDDSMRSQLERVLLASPTGLAAEEEAAAALFMSARTLARRLGAEGTSFREVRDGLLARRAAGHLRDGVPVASVASLLGYHDASGFRRAFKRWYGETPDAWRRTPSS